MHVQQECRNSDIAVAVSDKVRMCQTVGEQMGDHQKFKIVYSVIFFGAA